MSAHTPGPYYALQDNAANGRNIGIKYKGKFIGIAHTGAVRSPMVLNGREPIEEDEAKANAQLFVAAPKMLDALYKALTALYEAAGAGGIYFNGEIALLKAVIAEAEGNAPPIANPETA